MHRRIVIFIAVFLSAQPASAEPTALPIKADLSAAGWKTIGFNGIPETRFEGAADGVLTVTADHSASILYHAVDRPAGRLRWDWQAVGKSPATDVEKSHGDDRVLAVHVRFADPDDTSLFGGAALAMSPFARGRFITYVFGGLQAAQSGFPHPHLPKRAWMIVLRPANAPTGAWLGEDIDVAADYRRAYGAEAPPVTHIGISGDADDTKSTSIGLIRDIRFSND